MIHANQHIQRGAKQMTTTPFNSSTTQPLCAKISKWRPDLLSACQCARMVEVVAVSAMGRWVC